MYEVGPEAFDEVRQSSQPSPHPGRQPPAGPSICPPARSPLFRKLLRERRLAGLSYTCRYRGSTIASTLPLPPPSFDDLSVEEQLDYAQSLWDRIFPHPDEIPVPDWHRRIIDDRLASHRADPAAAVPWDEVREDLLEKLSNRPQRG